MAQPSQVDEYVRNATEYVSGPYFPNDDERYAEEQQLFEDDDLEAASRAVANIDNGRKLAFEDIEDPFAPSTLNQPLLANGEDPAPVKEKTMTFRESVRDPRKRTILLMFLTQFLVAIGFSIVMPSLFPYVAEFGGSESFYGLVVSAYSLAQLTFSPIFGYWSNRRSAKEPLLFALVFTVTGNLMYIIARSLVYQSGGKFFVMFARVVVGAGAGVVAVCRAYVSNVTTLKERGAAMAVMSASQGLGFCAGPVLGSLMSGLPTRGVGSLIPDYKIAPAYLAAILMIVNWFLLLKYFVDFREIVKPKSKKEKALEQETNNEEAAVSALSTQNPDGKEVPIHLRPEAKIYDKGAAVIMCFLFFCAALVFALNETLVPPLVQDEYGWTPQVVARNTGIYFAVGGIISVFLFLAARPLALRFGERQVMIAGLIGCFVGVFLFLPWGPPSTTECCYSNGNPYKPSQETNGEICCVPLQDDAEVFTCADKKPWCDSTPTLNKGQFYVASVFIFIFYPMANVMVITIFSKVLGPAPQGMGMGLLTSAGSFARTLGPAVSAGVYSTVGPKATFGMIAGLVGLGVVCAIFFYKRTIPHMLLRE